MASTSLKQTLDAETTAIFDNTWSTRDGRVVPTPQDIKFGNDGVELDATVLYSDLADSTKLVDAYSATFAAEVYKAFLKCAARSIRSEDGIIAAYDGDRVMAVFIGERMRSRAVIAALKINFCRIHIIQPRIDRYEPTYKIKHVTGIDTSKLLVARAGFRDNDDLVWIGRAANYAAKLCALPETHSTRITKEVYSRLAPDAKLSGDIDMWESVNWTAMNDHPIYRSNYFWKLS